MKKIFLFTLVISLMNCSVTKKKEVVVEEKNNSSVPTSSPTKLEKETISEVNKIPVVMTKIEQLPHFPGGQDSLNSFIKKI